MIRHSTLCAVFLLFLCSASLLAQSLELSRPARPWEFFDAVGQKAAVFGRENGRTEAWVYPLKLVRDLHLVFHFAGRSVSAEHYARTYTIRPEASTITYRGDFFQVQQTFFVPPDQAGAIIILDVDTFEPLEIEADFERDFQLMWPATIGATYMNWDNDLHAFTFGEESRQYFGAIGSPSAQISAREAWDNNAGSNRSAFRLGESKKGKDRKIIVIAGSVKSRDEMLRTYKQLAEQPDGLLNGAAAYYSDYLKRTVGLQLPDADLQRAYDWARISTIQGLVNNPLVGTGLIAGYRTSGNDWRPGFAWFFGRDSLWTDLALTSIGDFQGTRTALDFITKIQRADGKIPHEFSQSASLLPWFEKYPWGYASADATPLYIIALEDYVRASGDLDYARTRWENAWKAYQFMRSTYDEQGFAQNKGVGHGWIEGGPLLPVKVEHYQVGLQLQSLRSLARLAGVTGHKDAQQQLEVEFTEKRPHADKAFWSDPAGAYVYAIDENNRPLATVSVLSTVPMWFGVVDAQHAGRTIDVLARPDHHASWGMRIISDKDPRYDPTGYHFGSVWPLFTGWASVGEYKYHRPDAAYPNLRANALLTFSGALGRVMEVMSGTFHEQLATNSPHQIWSSAMVISPMLRGMMGLESDQFAGRLTFAPHLPVDWDKIAVTNIPACGGNITLNYQRTSSAIELTAKRAGTATCTLDFSPAVTLPSGINTARMVTVNGRAMQPQIEKHADMHARVSVPLASGTTVVHMRLTK